MLNEMYNALVAAERYMTRQRANSKAPYDPEALKQVRAAIAKYKAQENKPNVGAGADFQYMLSQQLRDRKKETS